MVGSLNKLFIMRGVFSTKKNKLVQKMTLNISPDFKLEKLKPEVTGRYLGVQVRVRQKGVTLARFWTFGERYLILYGLGLGNIKTTMEGF